MLPGEHAHSCHHLRQHQQSQTLEQALASWAWSFYALSQGGERLQSWSEHKLTQQLISAANDCSWLRCQHAFGAKLQW